MGLAATEQEIAERTARFVKAALKKKNVTYAELAEKLKEHGITSETEASVKSKLNRGTFAATFLIGVIAALEMDGLRMEDL